MSISDRQHFKDLSFNFGIMDVVGRYLTENNDIIAPPLDKVEPNLKKIPHRNGIWGLEANSM